MAIKEGVTIITKPKNSLRWFSGISRTMLVLHIVSLLVIIALCFAQRDLLFDVKDGVLSDPDLINILAARNDARLMKAAFTSFGIGIVSFVFFLVWVYKANSTITKMGVAGLTSPGWAVASFFIPIINLWKPCSVIKEIWKASLFGNKWSEAQKGSLHISFFWGIWILHGILRGLPAQTIARNPASLSGLIKAANISIILPAFSILSYLGAFYLITTTQKGISQLEEKGASAKTSPITEAEATILEMLESNAKLSEKIKTEISQISEIPFDDFAIIQRRGILRATTPMQPELFSLLGTPTKAWIAFALSIGMVVLPIIGIVMSFFVEWWFFIVGIVLGIVSFKAGKKLYFNTFFSAARSSEIIFSFLFSEGLISLEMPQHGFMIHYPEEESSVDSPT